MCRLCGDASERRAEMKECARVAEQLRKVAHVYEGYASGRLKPHSDEGNKAASTVKAVVRRLFEDWI